MRQWETIAFSLILWYNIFKKIRKGLIAMTINHRFLVVVDMQHDFIDGVLETPEAKAIVPKIRTLIDGLDKEKDYAIFTYDTHSKNYLKTAEGKHLPIPHCLVGTDGWKNVFSEAESVRTTNDSSLNHILIDRKSSFGSPELYNIIFKRMMSIQMEEWKHHDSDVKHEFQIELCGVCTDICVITNALVLKTMSPETPIYIHPNACAGVTPELHEAALKVMKSCQIDFLEDE